MRRTNKLTAAKVSKVQSAGMYGDGDGLWLQVREIEGGLSKAWIFRFMFAGRPATWDSVRCVRFPSQRLGHEQRKRAILIYAGADPLEHRRQRHDEARNQSAERLIFKDAAKRFLDLHRDNWKNEKHKQQWENTLRDYAYPVVRHRDLLPQSTAQ